MQLVHASIHTMKAREGQEVRYARLGYRTPTGYVGQSLLLNRLIPETLAIADSGALHTLGRRLN